MQISINNWFIDKTKKTNTQNRHYQTFIEWIRDLSNKKQVYYLFKKRAGLHQEGYADYEISVQQWYDQVYLPQKESIEYLQQEFSDVDKTTKSMSLHESIVKGGVTGYGTEGKSDEMKGNFDFKRNISNIRWWGEEEFKELIKYQPLVEFILFGCDIYLLENILKTKCNTDTVSRYDGVDSQASVGDSYDYIKPQHYTLWNDNNDVNQIIMDALTPEEYEGFCKGNILKYQLRLGKKPNESMEREKGKIAEYQKFLKISRQRNKF